MGRSGECLGNPFRMLCQKEQGDKVIAGGRDGIKKKILPTWEKMYKML
jgi:hypothetical protein